MGGVSRRQIFEDIKYMESDTGWSIPLERKKDGRKVYYCYENPDFTINEQPLTDEEAKQLETVIVTLSRFRGMPSNEWVDEVISNLEWRFNLRGNHESFIGFEQNEQLKGLAYLSPIIDATMHNQVLKITYRSFKESAVEKEVIVHPYFIKQYNNRWFLMAMDNDTHYLSNLALDRIHSLEIKDDVEYIKNKDINFDSYFNEVIGVTIPNEGVSREKIVLKFNARQFSYVVAKPLHPSQVIISEDNHLLSIEVRPNYELDYSILSLGPDVEVLEPISYREHIKNKLAECLNKYVSVQKDCTPDK